MKRSVYALSLLTMFISGCFKTPGGSTTTATSSTNTTSSASQTTSTASSSVAPVTATVEFTGLVCHLWNKQEAGVERAIVLRTPPSPSAMHHKMSLTLPAESRADILKLGLPLDPAGACSAGSTCSVLVDGLAFQFVDATGKPLSTPFSPNANFTNFVTHLRDVPHPAHPFATKDDLVDAALAPAPPPSKDPVVAGWFELAGGQGDAQSYACKGKFQGESAEHDFVQMATVTFTIPVGGRLQVIKEGDKQWNDIAIPSSDFRLTLDNDADPSTQTSHFGMYASLHKKKTPQEPDVQLPAVVVPNIQTCQPVPTSTVGVDAVPGCSNSGWP